MISRPSRPIIIMLVLLLLVGLGCNFSVSLGDKEEPTEAPAPTDTAVPPPTAEPQTPPTVEQPPTLEPQIPPTDPPPQSGIPGFNASASQPGEVYYNEKFEEMSGWVNMLLSGDQNGFGYTVFDNRLRTDIQTQDTWVYYMLEGVQFQDVRIDIQAQNRASNTNFVGMICRYSENGWYEANILNTGEYAVYYYSGEFGSGKLYQMEKGGTRLIKTGRSTNEYALICQGEWLTILINGVEELALPLRTGDFPFLDNGQVGLSVSTSYAIPVVVDFLKFILSVP